MCGPREERDGRNGWQTDSIKIFNGPLFFRSAAEILSTLANIEYLHSDGREHEPPECTRATVGPQICRVACASV